MSRSRMPCARCWGGPWVLRAPGACVPEHRFPPGNCERATPGVRGVFSFVVVGWAPEPVRPSAGAKGSAQSTR
eukprot:14040283-Alexandrium_andersonii.AAC.1